jgi:hypothetical protein
MKKLFLLNLALCLLVLPLHAQNVWSSKIDTFGNFVKPNSPHTHGVVSNFTPAAAITVNRIQLVAAGGQVCSSLPEIEVTDGTTHHSLEIPNTQVASGVGPASNDSGPITLSYPAGDLIQVKALPAPSGSCNPFEINIVVQYSVTAP